jgi:four helix bundle protein
MSNTEKYNLEHRTIAFAESVIDFAKSVSLNAITRPIISQLIRSATSIGANYCEADNAESRKDFRYKIGLCKKEASETKYWLQLLARAVPSSAYECRKLWKEAQELTLIFGAINRKQTSELRIKN